MKQYIRSGITLAILSFAVAKGPVVSQEIQPISMRQWESVPSPTNSSTTTNQEPLDFSGEGKPGKQTAGGSRGNCPDVNPNLTALIPASHSGKTVSKHPSFWFYVPYSSQQAPVGEFVLQDHQRNDVYRTPFTLPTVPGFVSFSIPETEAGLELERSYLWYFKIYCDRDKSSSSMYVQGWVERIAINPSLNNELITAGARQHMVYARNRIWYDALAHLIEIKKKNPHSTELKNDWNRLLQAKGVGLNLFDLQPVFRQIVLKK